MCYFSLTCRKCKKLVFASYFEEIIAEDAESQIVTKYFQICLCVKPPFTLIFELMININLMKTITKKSCFKVSTQGRLRLYHMNVLQDQRCGTVLNEPEIYQYNQLH